jgi:hypothetical protein
MDLLYYERKSSTEYPARRFKKICVCEPRCENVVDFLDPDLQEVLFTLCDNQAQDYAYKLMQLLGLMKIIPDPKTSSRTRIDGRTLNRTWTKAQERELINIVKNGVKSGDYRIFGMKHGKTRVSVKEKVRHMRKVGMIK